MDHLTVPPPSVTSGPLIDGWQTRKLIAQGGQGEVWQVHRQEDGVDRYRALKVLKLGEFPVSTYSVVLRLFRQEAEISRLICDPHILTYFDHGVLLNAHQRPPRLANPPTDLPENAPYLLMEFVEGDPLAKFLARHALGDSKDSIVTTREGLIVLLRALTLVAAQVAGALASLHDLGCIHRDVSPQNVLVLADRQQVKLPRAILVDFGIAKQARADKDDPTRIAIGNPNYCAPEQRREPAGSLTSAVDVFSLAMTLKESALRLLTASPDRNRPIDQQLSFTLIAEDPLGPVLSDLDALFGRCLQERPVDRCKASELSATLRALYERVRSVTTNTELPDPAVGRQFAQSYYKWASGQTMVDDGADGVRSFARWAERYPLTAGEKHFLSLITQYEHDRLERLARQLADVHAQLDRKRAELARQEFAAEALTREVHDLQRLRDEVQQQFSEQQTALEREASGRRRERTLKRGAYVGAVAAVAFMLTTIAMWQGIDGERAECNARVASFQEESQKKLDAAQASLNKVNSQLKDLNCASEQAKIDRMKTELEGTSKDLESTRKQAVGLSHRLGTSNKTVAGLQAELATCTTDKDSCQEVSRACIQDKTACETAKTGLETDKKVCLASLKPYQDLGPASDLILKKDCPKTVDTSTKKVEDPVKETPKDSKVDPVEPAKKTPAPGESG